MTPSIEQVVQYIKDTTAKIAADFTDPDDDWQGVMFFIGGDNDAMLPLMFENEREKDFVSTVAIPELIREHKPWIVAQLQSAWTLSLPREQAGRDDIPLPSQHPDRVEALIMIVCTVEQVQMWTAKINRYETRPPTLAAWELFQATGSEGRFITPIVETLKEVHG